MCLSTVRSKLTMLRCINNGQMKDSRKSESASEEDGLDGREGRRVLASGLVLWIRARQSVRDETDEGAVR